MAVTQGSKASSTDIQSWYNSLNSIISNFGGGTIGTLTVPSTNKKIEASDINNYYNKMTEMKKDTYLGNQAGLYPSYSVVSSGTKIMTNIGTVAASAVDANHLGAIKCRNQANNSNSTNSNASKNNSTNANSTNNNGSNSNGNHNNGSNNNSYGVFFYSGNVTNSNSSRRFSNTSKGTSCSSNGTCRRSACTTNGACGAHGACGANGNCTTNGACSAHGTCTQGTVIDITNSNTTKSNTQ